MLHVCMCVRATVLNTALSLVPALSTLVVVLVVVTVVAAKQLVPKIDNAHAFIVIIIFVTSASHSTSVVLLLLFNRGTKRFGRRRKPCHSILGSTQKNSDPEWDGGWANGRERASAQRTRPPSATTASTHTCLLTQNYPRAAQFALIFRFFTRAALSGSSASFSVIISNRA